MSGKSDNKQPVAVRGADERIHSPDCDGGDAAQVPETRTHQPGQQILLSDPLDRHYLSSLLCHIRLQIEIFPASAEDIEARSKKGGSSHKCLGRVGIRCKWCAHLPHKERAKGAASYPVSVRLVHQAVRNWQRYHLMACPHIPQTIKDRVKVSGERKKSGQRSVEYWLESLERKGMYDAEEEVGGIKLRGFDYSHADNAVIAISPEKGSRKNQSKKPAGKKTTQATCEVNVKAQTDAKGEAKRSRKKQSKKSAAKRTEQATEKIGGEAKAKAEAWSSAQNELHTLHGVWAVNPALEPTIDPFDVGTGIRRGTAVLDGLQLGPWPHENGSDNTKHESLSACRSVPDAEHATLDLSDGSSLFSAPGDFFNDITDIQFDKDHATAEEDSVGGRAELPGVMTSSPSLEPARGSPGLLLGVKSSDGVNLDAQIDTNDTLCNDECGFDESRLACHNGRSEQPRKSLGGKPDKGLVSSKTGESAKPAPRPVHSLDHIGGVDVDSFLELSSHRTFPAFPADADKVFDSVTNTNANVFVLEKTEAKTRAIDDISATTPVAKPTSAVMADAQHVSQNISPAQFPSQVDAGGNGLLEQELRNTTDGSSSTHTPADLEPIPLHAKSSGNLIPCETNSAVAPARGKQSKELVRKVHMAYEIIQAADMIQPIRESYENSASTDLRSTRPPGDPKACQVQSEAQNDLRPLGVDLYELFAEVQPFHKPHEDNRGDSGEDVDGSDCHRQKKKERKAASGNYTPLHELGFPVLLSNLVSSLLEGNGGGGTSTGAPTSHQLLDQVKEDLRLMTTYPDRYLFNCADAQDQRHHCGSVQGGEITLQFPRKSLYGRREQCLRLMEAYNRVIQSGGAREMLLVSGYSGTGKSTLVKHVRGALVEKGYFISGKFDELRQMQPLSAIVNAFNDYCDALTKNDAAVLGEIRAAIKDAIGSDGKVLTDLIPNLCKVIVQPAADLSVAVEGKESLNRLVFLFRKLLRAISSAAHPIVLFLDDLQWADGASLELISSLVADAENKHVLFLGCYRDNEVSEEHLLMTQLKSIERSGVKITTINIDNLEREAVNELISDTLRLSPPQTKSLSDLVYSKTSGNALFVVQFLRSLNDDGLLNFSLVTRRWEWDMEAILSKKVADNVVDLLTTNMLKLPAQVLWSLKLAACLGCRCEGDVMRLLDANGAGELDVAVREGLLFKIGTIYRFSHDQIQHAAYSLLQTGGQAAVHLLIGRILSEKASESNMDSILFVMADQFHRGSSLIFDREEKNDLAKIYLMAGKKAMSSAAFLLASFYLLQGINLLNDSHWMTHYDLALDLFSCCAETQSVIGNLDKATELINPVLKYGRSLRDKLSAQYTLVQSLGCKPLDAIRCCLDVLSQLGESFPDQPSKERVLEVFVTTRSMLEYTTVNGILQSVEMHDANSVATMRFLVDLTRIAFHLSRHDLMSLAVFRMVQLSLSDGLCKDSSFAFASFGFVLCGFREYELGYQYGKLALQILERTKAKERLARVYLTLYGHLNVFTEPLQGSLPSLKYGYEVGMSVGDNEWAFHCAVGYIRNGFFSGLKLELLTADANAYLNLMGEYKNESSIVALKSLHQTALNLMGRSDDVTVLTGEAMNQDDVMNYLLDHKLPGYTGEIYLMRMILTYMFGWYELAAEMAERRLALFQERPVRNATIISETFYMGLIAAATTRAGFTSEEGKWRDIAYDARHELETWAKHSPWNCHHKLELLNAEIAYLNGHLDGAAKAYDEAIRLAGEHKFVHEQALACERAGVFHSEVSNSMIARGYFVRARGYYLEWGATRKADDLLERLNDELQYCM